MEQTVLKLKKMERDIMFNIDNDLRQAQSSYEQVAALRKAREFAESDLAAEQKELESRQEHHLYRPAQNSAI